MISTRNCHQCKFNNTSPVASPNNPETKSILHTCGKGLAEVIKKFFADTKDMSVIETSGIEMACFEQKLKFV